MGNHLLCNAWFQASDVPKKERSHPATFPSWLEMIKLGKFPTFFGAQISIFFYFAYFLKPTPTLGYFMLKMIRSEIFCKNSHWKGVKTPDLWSAQYFSHPNHCIFQSKIVEKVLILKLYNLAHFILALWPLRLLRAFWKNDVLASNQCAVSTVHYSSDLMCALLK